MIKAYDEIVDFIATGTTPETVAAFCASPESQDRVGLVAPGEDNGFDTGRIVGT